MTEQEFTTYQTELLAKVEKLYKNDELFKIIDLLENSELDFELCMELVRTYINAANRTSDPFSLFEKSEILLDKFSLEGKISAKYHFLRGYILFKKGLISDSLIRFEEALKHASVMDGQLFSNITIMIDNAKRLLDKAEFKGLDEKDSKELLSFVEKNFGKVNHLCEFSHVSLYQISPTKEHDYNLIVSVGLSGKNTESSLKLKQDSKQENIELCLALPKDYRFNKDSKSSFEIYMLIEIISYLITEKNPVGFGYYLEKENGFSKRTAFTGAMLASLGEYPKENQSVILSSGRNVNFYELLPLRPMELNFRKTHSAHALFELFKEHLIKLTPFISTRDDVCQRLNKE